MMDGVLKRIDFAKVQIDQHNSDMIGRREFNIIFVDSFKAFERINPANKTMNYDFNEYYLIFLKVDNTKEDLLKILVYCWKHYIINVSIIVEQSPEVLDLYTYFPFSKLKCQNTDPIVINQFKMGAPANGNKIDDIFPKKLKSLQGCPLTAALWNVPPYLRILPNRTGLEKFVGFEGVLLRVLAKNLEFSLDYVIPPNDEERGKRFPNGTITGAMKLIKERKADLTLGSFRYTVDRADVMTAALPYYQTWQIFTVPKASFQYTPIQILFCPFTPLTWLSLLAFVTILISFRNLAISYHRVLGPLLLGITANQIVASFLGASISKLPNGNFIRYMLMLWIICAFVIRCAYQSLLFKLLQSNLNKKPPETYEELIDLNYTFVMNQGTIDTINSMLKNENGKFRYIITQNSSNMCTFDFIENASGKFAGISPMDYLTYYAMIQSKRGVFHVLNEKIIAQHNTLYFSKHSYLIERFNGILMNLRSSGLINLWASQHMDSSFFVKGKNDKEALKFKQLRGTFDVYLMFLIVAFIIFLLELLSKRIKLIRRVLECLC
ncbi:uncharacterized protein LOC129944771 [Eupeodes corollae]|uniref:uncharacterized protein LOC129944771 n=1 Tax=Eupeodes corollae TaxID=290404 RepID=UPI002492A651|nr:uncharacterized protein LOC129944771 [Eupeodes corollae]